MDLSPVKIDKCVRRIYLMRAIEERERSDPIALSVLNESE
jgi:hypothetical protein